MKTFKFTTTATRIATLLAIFGFIAFAGETTWAQKGNGAGKSGSHRQAASKSKQANNGPKVNRNDKTFRFGKTISAGPRPLPTIDREDKYRRRGTSVQNGVNAFHGNASGSPLPMEEVSFTFLSTPRSGAGQTDPGATNQRTTNLPTGGSVGNPYSSLNIDNTTAVRSRGMQAGQGNQIVAGNFIGTNKLKNKEPDWLSYEPLGLSGQDQETGEIIVFGQRRESSLNSLARPQSLVESEGWDEVPEGMMFQSRSGSGSGIGRTDAIAKSKLGEASMSYLSGSATDTGHNGILHKAIGRGIVSPRDPASGQATGKRK